MFLYHRFTLGKMLVQIYNNRHILSLNLNKLKSILKTKYLTEVYLIISVCWFYKI